MSYQKIGQVIKHLEAEVGWTPQNERIRRVLEQSETANSTPANTSSEQDTTSTKSRECSAEVMQVATVPASSPLRRAASKDEVVSTILQLGLATGHVVERHRTDIIAAALTSAGWTVAELEAAYAAIVSTARLLREISYNRTIGPGVFAEARLERSVQRSRLFEREDAIREAEKEKLALSQMFEAVRAAEDNRVLWRMR